MSTSNRKQAFAQPQSNPATKFIDWKSNEKAFSFYDKENKVNVPIPLPFRFLALDQLSTIKGWNESLKGNYSSNEVKYMNEILNVVTYHKDYSGKSVKTEFVKGLYSDIKEKIKAAGAHYVKSIYIMLEDGSLANLQLKGSACQAWGDFTKKSKSRLSEEWVTVEKAIEGKKGAVKYYTPEFKFDKSLSENENTMADDAFAILETYLKAYLVKAEPVVQSIDSDVLATIDEDDLEF